MSYTQSYIFQILLQYSCSQHMRRDSTKNFHQNYSQLTLRKTIVEKTVTWLQHDNTHSFPLHRSVFENGSPVFQYPVWIIDKEGSCLYALYVSCQCTACSLPFHQSSVKRKVLQKPPLTAGPTTKFTFGKAGKKTISVLHNCRINRPVS